MHNKVAAFLGVMALGVLAALYGCEQHPSGGNSLGTSFKDIPPQCFEQASYNRVGTASWYGRKFKGKETASGEPFDPNALTAAHRSLPLGSKVKVTNLENGKQTIVTVKDRGPYKRGRIIDLSQAAAQQIGIGADDGKAKVRVQAVGGDGC
jgi:rare lipoprotein A